MSPPKRPPSIMGDDERAAIGRLERRTPRGVPVAIDPEVTPPPRMPPDVTSLEGFGDLPPEMQAPLVAIHHVQREQDVAIARLWETRHVPEQLERLTLAVNLIADRTKSFPEFAKAVNSQAGAVARLAERVGDLVKIDESFRRALEALDGRLDELEIERATDRTTLASEIARLNTELIAAKAADTAAKDGASALEVRVRSLEDTRTRARGAWWMITAAMAAIATAFGLFGHAIAEWIRGAPQK